MSTVYTQKIFSIEVIPNDGNLENVVIRVQWEYQARNSTHYAVTVHNTELSSVANPDNFVSYENLTEEIVLAWLKNQVDMITLKSDLDAMLSQEMQKPRVQKSPPWFDPDDNILTKLYVIVKNNEIIWGPSRWNTAQMNESLAYHGVKQVLPNAVAIIPENTPTLVDEHTFVYQVHSHGHEEYNHITERLTAEFLFEEFNGKAIITRKKQAVELDQIKQELSSELKTRYFANTEFTKTFSDGNTIIIPYSEISELGIPLFLSESGDTFDFKTTDDLIITLDKNEFTLLMKDCINYYKDEKSKLNTALVSISECTSTEEILQAAQKLSL